MYEKEPPKVPLSLYIDDPNLIFEPIENQPRLRKKHHKVGSLDKPLKNRYNLSNDKYYEIETTSKSSLVSFGVQHSIPALKLSNEFFAINFTADELINWHRSTNTLLNTTYYFSNPMQITAKSNTIRKHYEVSCNDLTDFILFEYSEEFPFFVPKPGMASIFEKYYRKLDDGNEHTTKGFKVLECEEEGPFMGYGDIHRGETVCVLDNNMFVAPVYEHTTKDYLVINSNGKLIFRKIPKLFVVGQELPKIEVFAPHSRKLNQFSRDRLKIYCHRLFMKKKSFTIEELNKTFPFFTEGSKRKWIREYSDPDKSSRENIFGYKPGSLIYKEDELRKLVTPENICQFESMLVEEKRVESLGFKLIDVDEDDKDYVPSWVLSRNFVNATSGKGLLEIEGKIEPTGIGEAMSFVRKKYKKVSEQESRKLLSEHQTIYRSLIDKIFKRQSMALSSKTPPLLKENQRTVKFDEKEVNKEDKENRLSEQAALIIKRYYTINGQIEERIEKVYDKRVIKAYLKIKRKSKPEEKKTSLKCSSCGQVGHMKTNKNCPNYQGPSKKKTVEKKAPIVRLSDKFSRLISQFTAIPYSTPFHRPVNQKKFPTYRQIISKPIDFLTMKTKNRNHDYSSFDEFISDLVLMHDNCLRFNGPGHSLTEISQEFINKAKSFQIENFEELSEIEKGILKTNKPTFL
ncbi:T111 [Hepatospora eriocheir]|uniref:T111 n=1 Tax=Hepatospora eriocheir TaxID=1081669 RepID=A0A1X0Q7X9_9MICR|nr:T111 [Hepatospora eriocheir]